MMNSKLSLPAHVNHIMEGESTTLSISADENVSQLPDRQGSNVWSFIS